MHSVTLKYASHNRHVLISQIMANIEYCRRVFYYTVNTIIKCLEQMSCKNIAKALKGGTSKQGQIRGGTQLSIVIRIEWSSHHPCQFWCVKHKVNNYSV